MATTTTTTPHADTAAATDSATAEPSATEPAATEPTGTTAAPASNVDGSDLTVGLTFDLLGPRRPVVQRLGRRRHADKAKADFGVTVNEVTPTDASARGTDLQLQAENAGLVIGVGFSFATDAATIAAENPDVMFAIVDDSMMNFDATPPAPIAENAAGLVFSEEQGSYLVGVAAALKSTTGKIGFIGGVSGIGLIEKFEAGYTAGAKSINPDIEVVADVHHRVPRLRRLREPRPCRRDRLGDVLEGADIIYAAAGLSGSGMFQAAADTTAATGTKVWGIGVDSDQYNTVDPAVQEYVLTSMIKRVDVAVYDVIKSVIDGTFAPGERRYDLAVDGVGYATSGGFIDDIVDAARRGQGGDHRRHGGRSHRPRRSLITRLTPQHELTCAACRRRFPCQAGSG